MKPTKDIKKGKYDEVAAIESLAKKLKDIIEDEMIKGISPVTVLGVLDLNAQGLRNALMKEVQTNEKN